MRRRLRNSATFAATVRAGMANPRPCVGVPCGVNASFTDEIPTSRPARSMSGPPRVAGVDGGVGLDEVLVSWFPRR